MIESIIFMIMRLKEYIHNRFSNKTEFYTDEVIDKMMGGKDNYIDLNEVEKWKINKMR